MCWALTGFEPRSTCDEQVSVRFAYSPPYNSELTELGLSYLPAKECVLLGREGSTPDGDANIAVDEKFNLRYNTCISC